MAGAPAQRELEARLDASTRVLDLGSGPNPVRKATAAVDLLIEPGQRDHGRGARIDADALQARGVAFHNQSIDRRLPFADGEFDFVHCSHVIEHVENPGTACDEMTRVGTAGLLRCPSAMAEYLLGREYHRWIVLQRSGTLVFVEKTADEYALFGRSDARDAAAINPFEALLDWAGERPSTGRNGIVRRARQRLQRLFYNRTPQSEVNLFWRGGFRWVEVRATGEVKSGGGGGDSYSYSFDEAGTRIEYPATPLGER
jgi:hypothetical protein